MRIRVLPVSSQSPKELMESFVGCLFLFSVHYNISVEYAEGAWILKQTIENIQSMRKEEERGLYNCPGYEEENMDLFLACPKS